MAIVYSNSFNVAVDTNLLTYGAPDWYAVYNATLGRTQVIAASGNVQKTFDFEQSVHGLVHSLIGGINDYEVTATIGRTTDLQMGMVVARCGANNSQNFYRLGCDGADDITLERWIAGVATGLKTTTTTIPTNTTMPVMLRVTGTNPVVLTYSINGVIDTFSDSNAARLTSGPPGIAMQRSGTAQSGVTLDNFSVLDLGHAGVSTFQSVRRVMSWYYNNR